MDDGQPIVAAVEEKGVSPERWYALLGMPIKRIELNFEKSQEKSKINCLNI